MQVQQVLNYIREKNVRATYVPSKTVIVILV